MKHSPLNEPEFTDYSYQGIVGDGSVYYRYNPPSPLSRWIQCFWQLSVPQGDYIYRSVPDNNVDCIFTINHIEENLVVLPFSAPTLFEINGPVTYFGIRFRVLAQQWLTTIPVGEWGNSCFEDIFGTYLLMSLLDNIEAADNFHTRSNSVSKLLLANLSNAHIDKRLVSFVRHTYQHASSRINLSDQQCNEFALSSRHLRRLSQLYLGLSPRNFHRVVRFQNTLHLMNTTNISQVWANSYYDQPHFIREFKRLSGVTPSEFSSSSVLYNTSDTLM